MGYDISIIVRRRNAETRVQLEGKGLTLYLGLHNLSPDPRAIGKYTPLLSWIWGQVTKRLDFGARKCIGGTANLTKLEP